MSAKNLPKNRVYQKRYRESSKGKASILKCRTKKNEVRRQKYKAGQDRAMQLRLKYGLSLEQYDTMVEAQGGRCAICEKAPPFNSGRNGQCLHVDHDHQTGAVRGLLCNNCNRGIGMIGDANLQAAVAYLTGKEVRSQ